MRQILIFLIALFFVNVTVAQKINRGFLVVGYDSIPTTVPNKYFKYSTIGYVDSLSEIWYYNNHMPDSLPPQWLELTGGVRTLGYNYDSTKLVTFDDVGTALDSIPYSIDLDGLWSDGTSIYTGRKVGIGRDNYTTYDLLIDGNTINRGFFRIEAAAPALHFANDTVNVDGAIILSNDSTFVLSSIGRVGWGGNGISIVPTESLDIPGTARMRGIDLDALTDSDYMMVMDTTDKVARLVPIEVGTTYNDSILPYGITGVSRVPTIGDNLNASTTKEWIEWWYTANYQQPTISMNSISPTIVEVGTSNGYTLAGSITNPCSFTLSSRLVDGTSFAGSSYSKGVNYQPTVKQTKTYQASVAWDETGTTCADGSPNTGTAVATRSINAVHPVLWGVSSTSYTSGSVPYNLWSKLVASEGNKTLTLPSGTSVFIYFLVPKSWTDFNLSSILDHNGFEVLPSFTTHDISVTSTGLVNNWTQDYKLYKLNSLTSTIGTEAYQIIR